MYYKFYNYHKLEHQLRLKAIGSRVVLRNSQADILVAAVSQLAHVAVFQVQRQGGEEGESHQGDLDDGDERAA